MADKKSFVLYCDYKKHFALLPAEDQGRLLMAIFDYVETGTEPALESSSLMAFSFIRAQLDRDIEKYKEICRKRKEVGSRGGRPSKAEGKSENQTEAKKANGFSENQTEAKKANGFSENQTEAKKANGFSENQTEAKKPDNDTVTDNGTDNGTDTDINNNRGNSPELPGEKKSTRFVPPTVEDVRAYCQERHNGVNPETFVDFYTGKGWFVGMNKMKDWKAAVRTWERSRNGQTQTQKINREDYDNGDQEPW